jgi:hypothetical protein
LKVHKRVPESTIWKLSVPGESRCFAAMKFWKILHEQNENLPDGVYHFEIEMAKQI